MCSIFKTGVQYRDQSQLSMRSKVSVCGFFGRSIFFGPALRPGCASIAWRKRSGLVDVLGLEVPASGVGFFGVDGLHDERAVVLLALVRGAAKVLHHGVRCDCGIRRAQCLMAEARPAVISWVGHHFCVYRVEFDVALALQQVAIVADRACFVATLPQRAGAAVAVIDVSDIAAAPMPAWCDRRRPRRLRRRIGGYQ